MDRYYRYNQISIHPKDQEKTTFTYLYEAFALRRMSFIFCNAPAMFQRCMMTIFTNMAEDFMEIFMNDFSIFGSTFNIRLKHTEEVLKRSNEINLMLNWEVSFYGEKMNSFGIQSFIYRNWSGWDNGESDWEAPCSNINEKYSQFHGTCQILQEIYQIFLKITKPIYNLLIKDTQWDFDRNCLHAFEVLKKALISAPIIVLLDWTLPFEQMCDAINYAIGAVHGQKKGKGFSCYILSQPNAK